MTTRRQFLARTTLAGIAAASATSVDQSLAQTGRSARESSLQSYRIPQTDLTVSRLAYGCAMLDWYKDWTSPEFIRKTVPMIELAYEQGITFFDLADMYGFGKSEEAMGQVLKSRPGLRDEVVIQSKCGERFKEGWIVDSSHDYIVRSVEGSLKRLATDRLDLLLLHFPDSLVEPEEVARAFDELHRSGKVRHFGVSNHSPMQIEFLKKYVRQPLVVNQIQIGLACWQAKPNDYRAALGHDTGSVATLNYCRMHDIQVQAYSPLKTGNFGKPPSLLKPAPDASPEVIRTAQLLAEIAKIHNASPAVIMLAWLLRHPAGIVPIIGATNPKYVIENCTADRVELTRQQWYSLLHSASEIFS